MEVTISNSPRFIEVDGSLDRPPLNVLEPEIPFERLFIRWDDVLEMEVLSDKCFCFTMRQVVYSYEKDRCLNEYEACCHDMWVCEDFAHFVRRVNKGLPITMIKDGDE